jgi:phospholipid:diacylglycerol acyltransferase
MRSGNAEVDLEVLIQGSQPRSGYWVWQKIVQNLAAVGYDPNSLDMAAYDWRLAYYNLEVRDAFFSRLKSKIELYRQTNKEKVILCSHSMGGSVVMYFLKWVEAMPEDDVDGHGFGGGGGPQWVEDNVEAVINVAGTLLGVAKSMTAFLSGEMKDTVEIVSNRPLLVCVEVYMTRWSCVIPASRRLLGP